MSGIVGIVHQNGAPVDRQLLRRMTLFLDFRGPDAQGIWTDGPVGFGHAMLFTTRESATERQPASLEGEVWITADARVDGRPELLGKLKSEGRGVSETATDAELILHAYNVWGEDCVEHLLGDFAFAIWDSRSHRLFCARDHFGIKPFYYAHLGGCLVFSNTLECMRLHPGPSDELNDLAVADFLLFDFNQELATTVFADIQRLPPAHLLTWSQGELRVERYWTFPVEGPIRYKRASEYVDHFRALMRNAVGDRLRTDSVGVLMSGGLDSSIVAATAKAVLSDEVAPFDLRAYTEVYERLIPHQERHYAGLAAEALDIPLQCLGLDDYPLYGGGDQFELRPPEPFHHPLAAPEADHLRRIAASHRVALTGFGGDPALSTSLSSHFAKLLKGWRFDRVASDLCRFFMAEGRLSRLYVRTRLEILFGRKRWRSLFPVWLNEELSARLDLPARWERLNSEHAPEHAVRPVAYEQMVAPFWTDLFEKQDSGVTHVPVEIRHPFFDLRLARYLLRLPPLPWCSDKELLRVAMRGILPERVRLRRKSPLKADPIVALLQQSGAEWVDHFQPEPALSRYVDRSRVPPVAGEKDSWGAWVNLRPLSLNFWLQFQVPIVYKCGREGFNGVTTAKTQKEDLSVPTAACIRRCPWVDADESERCGQP